MIDAYIFVFSSAFLALFPVVNPIGSAFIVNGYLACLEEADRKRAVKKITLYSLCVGLGSACLGHFILLLFGLAIPVIQLGGGVLICKTGFEWLHDSESEKSGQPVASTDRQSFEEIEKALFYPITFPITVGAGTMSVIFTLLANAIVKDNLLKTAIHYAIIGLAFITICIILYIFLYQGKRIMGMVNEATNEAIKKLIAFFTFAVGIQIMLTGISNIFHINIL